MKKQPWLLPTDWSKRMNMGLDERIENLIHKRNRPEGYEDNIMDKKAETRAFMDKIEAVIGKSIDSLFKKG